MMCSGNYQVTQKRALVILIWEDVYEEPVQLVVLKMSESEKQDNEWS